MFLYAGAGTLRGFLRMESDLQRFPVVIVQCTYLETQDRPENSTHTAFSELSALFKRVCRLFFFLPLSFVISLAHL